MENLKEQIQELQKTLILTITLYFLAVPVSLPKVGFRTFEVWTVCTISNTTILRRPY